MTCTYAAYKRLTSEQKTSQIENEVLEKNILSKWTGKKQQPRVEICISDKIYLKTKAIKRNTEVHFIILKGRIHQEDISIVNIHVPNIGAPKYIKKILENFKKDIDSNTHSTGSQHPTVKNG